MRSGEAAASMRGVDAAEVRQDQEDRCPTNVHAQKNWSGPTRSTVVTERPSRVHRYSAAQRFAPEKLSLALSAMIEMIEGLIRMILNWRKFPKAIFLHPCTLQYADANSMSRKRKLNFRLFTRARSFAWSNKC